jgi:hypothetical protein
VKAELRQKWVAALRSGAYQQTKRHLKDDAGYCCLGVLLECAGKRFILDDFPTESQLATMGLNEEVAHELAEHNDNGMPFGLIADYIEEKVVSRRSSGNGRAE